MNWRKFKFSDLKEVKKVKKEIDFSKLEYFSVKVVKVRKKKREKIQCNNHCLIFNNNQIVCYKCGEVFGGNKRPKGNFVNGENLDKIMFPCLCSFLIDGERVYGELDDCVNYNRQIICLKELVEQIGQLNIRMDKQRYYLEFPICDLGSIVKTKNIHILKGKIIIFEEVK